MDTPTTRSDPESEAAAYAKLGTAGSGIVGEVFAGEHASSHLKVLLEEIPQDYLKDSDFIAELSARGKDCCALNSSHVVPTYDLVSLGGSHFLVTGVPSGSKLSAAHAGITETRFLSAASTLLAGLDDLHAASICHGAICAETVYSAADGSVAISDVAICSTFRTLGRDVPTIPGTPIPFSNDGDIQAAAGLLLTMTSHSAIPKDVLDSVQPVLELASRRTSFSTGADLQSAITDAVAKVRDPRGTAASPPVRAAAAEAPSQERTVAPPAAAISAPPPHEEPKTPAELVATPVSSKVASHHPVRAVMIGFVIVVLVLAGGSGAWFLWIRNALNNGPLAVTSSVSLSVAPRSGGCTVTFTANAKGTTKGRGTLTYRWIDATGTDSATDDTPSPILKLPIPDKDRSFLVEHKWMVSASSSFKGSITLDVLSPTPKKITAPVSVSCASS